MSSAEDEAVNIDDIYRSRDLLAGKAVYTPLLENEYVNDLAGRRVLLKAECLQRTGSFKFRGGWSAVSQLDEASRSRGVLAYSSGNHAQGVALAARIAGVRATIIMPSDAPTVKIENTKDLGAEVIIYDRPGGEDRELIGQQLAFDRGLTLIKPYDNPHVIAGQGTVGLEIAEQATIAGVSAADVLVCCGGGGLSAGIALALEANAPGLIVRPVEPVAGDDVVRSLQSGRREFNVGQPNSICDAIVTPSPGELTFPILKRLCGRGLTVTDDEALNAMAVAVRGFKLVAEPGGAVALAAALGDHTSLTGDTVICVLSGGNVDPALLALALQRFG